jgi:cytochrome c553
MRWLVVAALLLSGCSKNDKPPAPTSGSPGAKPETGPGSHPSGGGGDADQLAADIFANTCAMCHGPNGKGDGQMAQNLTPKPRDYTDPAWQASVTDEQIKTIIMEGGQAVGKSPSMPAQKAQLAGKPEVLDALVKIIRGFGPKK